MTAPLIWAGFSSAKREAIKVALLCGPEGSDNNLSGSYGSQYTAMQMIIWEFVVGVRSTTAPYTCSDSKVIESVCHDGANSEVKTVYNQIVAAMRSYNTLPSFMNDMDAPPPYQFLEYSNGTYSASFTDTNGVLSNYNITCSDPSVTLSVSGNTLTVTTTTPITGETIYAERKTAASASSQIVAYSGSGLQETIVGIEAVGGTTGYFCVATDYTPSGNIKIVKTADDGKVSGITFTITGNGVNKTVTTGSGGTITVSGLAPGTYTVTETVPSGYTADKVSQSVTVTDGQTTIVSFHNTLQTGNMKIVKTADDGNVSGIKFTISGNGIIWTATTGADGTITMTELVPGTYTVTENVPDGYTADKKSQTVTVEYGKTATVYFHNSLSTGGLKIVKTSDDGKVNGIKFTISGNGVNKTVTTGADGTITVDSLTPGTYTVTETVPEGYVCSNPSQTITVKTGETATVNFQNTLKRWRITVTKVDLDQRGKTLVGAVYGIYKAGVLQDTYTTDSTGKFTTQYYPCGNDWTLCEITPPVGYNSDPTHFPIGAEPGEFTSASNGLDMTVADPVITGTLVIVKQDEENQKPLAGATFRVYDENGDTVAEVTTGTDGKATFPDLQYGEYTYQEVVAPKYFQLDENIYDFSILEDGKTITETRENTRIPGSITVKKVDTKGNNLAGAEYLLEWSTDGRTWKPVTFRSDTPVTAGGCTSTGLSNGQLTTGKDGTVTFSGLRADGEIRYRLTERQAPAGMALLKDPVYQGTLPVENRDDLIYDISYTVTDNRITELPHTGGSGFDPVTFGIVLAGLAGCTGIFIIKNSKRRTSL